MVEKDAARKPPEKSRAPNDIGSLTLTRRVAKFVRGATSIAMEKLRPPIYAKSRVPASGKVLWER